MTQDSSLTKEETAAWRLASLATSAAVTELPKFSGWLMTGLGAALTFFVANHSSVSLLISISCIRVALFLFAGSMLFGLLAQWLAIPVRASLAFSTEALQLRSLELDPTAFLQSFASLLILPYRCLFICRIASASAKSTDALSPIRSPARLSQYLAMFVIIQYLLAISVVVVLAFGVKV